MFRCTTALFQWPLVCFVEHQRKYSRYHPWSAADHARRHHLQDSRVHKAVVNAAHGLQTVSADILARQLLGSIRVETRLKVSYQVSQRLSKIYFSYQSLGVDNASEKSSRFDQ